MAKPLYFDASLDLIEEGPVVEQVVIRRRPEDGGHVGHATKYLRSLSHPMPALNTMHCGG